MGFSRQEYWSGVPSPSPMFFTAAAAAKLLQSCPTLCDPIDGSPPGSPVPGIQARTLEWVAISFSNAWKWKVKVKSLSRARLLVTPMDCSPPGSLSLGFSKQEYWSGVPLPSPYKCTHMYKCTYYKTYLCLWEKLRWCTTCSFQVFASFPWFCTFSGIGICSRAPLLLITSP